VEDIAGALARIGVALGVAIHPVAVRPVALDGDEREPAFLDQSARQRGSPLIELGRPVSCFAQQDIARVADTFDERVEVALGFERQGTLRNTPGDGIRRVLFPLGSLVVVDPHDWLPTQPRSLFLQTRGESRTAARSVEPVAPRDYSLPRGDRASPLARRQSPVFRDDSQRTRRKSSVQTSLTRSVTVK
jgi:hypothetical protein